MAAGRGRDQMMFRRKTAGTRAGFSPPSNMATIKHNFTIVAPREQVFQAVSTLDGLNGWWTTGTTGNPNRGGKLRFEFDNGCYNLMQVTDVRRNKFAAWKCRESSFPSGREWIGTVVTFRLSKDGERNTQVEFEHGGWRKASDFYGRCNFHWGRFMVSLKLLCETSRGEPYVVGSETDPGIPKMEMARAGGAMRTA